MTTDQAEVTEVVETELAAAPGGGRRASGGGRWRWWLLLLALLVAVSGAFMWWQASNDEDLEAADTRDTVLMQTRKNIETINTLDHRKVDEGVKAWSAVTTGTLHDQLARVSTEDRRLLAEQEKISTGRVVDAAIVDLDDTTATVIAAVEVTVADAAKPDSEPTVKRNRFSADVVLVDGRWKLESLQQVAVNLS